MKVGREAARGGGRGGGWKPDYPENPWRRASENATY